MFSIVRELWDCSSEYLFIGYKALTIWRGGHTGLHTTPQIIINISTIRRSPSYIFACSSFADTHTTHTCVCCKVNNWPDDRPGLVVFTLRICKHTEQCGRITNLAFAIGILLSQFVNGFPFVCFAVARFRVMMMIVSPIDGAVNWPMLRSKQQLIPNWRHIQTWAFHKIDCYLFTTAGWAAHPVRRLVGK